MKLLRVLTLVAVLAVPGNVRAAGISSVQADLKVGGALPALKTGGASQALKPASPLAHLNQVNSAGYVRLTPSTATGAGRRSILGPVQSGGARSIGEIHAGLRNLAFPAAPASLGLRGERRLTPLTEAQLNLQLAVYRKIEAEQVEFFALQPLSSASLNSGVALPNGWVLRVHGANRYSLLDPKTGRGFTVWGDPHFSSDVSGRLDAQGSTHYGDFEHSAMVFVLPAVSASERVIVLARSEGGDAKNGFGLPTDLMVISDKKSVYVDGLNTASPKGYQGGDAYFLFKAHESVIKTAPVLFWDEASSELRHSSGDRSAPPTQAAQYSRNTPKLSRDNDQTLLQGDFRVAWGAAGDPTEPELQALFGQALAGTKSTVPAVQSAAKTYVTDSKTYAATMSSYIGDRVKVLATLEKIQSRIADIVKQLGDETLSTDQINALANELEALKRQAKENIKDLEKAPATRK